jgi:hypothetical protein
MVLLFTTEKAASESDDVTVITSWILSCSLLAFVFILNQSLIAGKIPLFEILKKLQRRLIKPFYRIHFLL